MLWSSGNEFAAFFQAGPSDGRHVVVSCPPGGTNPSCGQLESISASLSRR